MTRTIDNCKVIQYYGKPQQHNGLCDGILKRGALLEACNKCFLHDINNARKICAECGKEYFSTNGNSRFCSEDCKETYKKKHRKYVKKPKRKTLDEVLAELDEYNRTHGMHLTYGKYQNMKYIEQLRNEKNEKNRK